MRLIILGLLVLMPYHVFAGWVLVPEQSNVSFVSTKKGHVAEVHHFKQLQGHVTKDNKVMVDIVLSSVETNIPIRNERMQKMLFETDTFSKASISASVDLSKIQSMKSMQIDATLDLHGHQQAIKLDVMIANVMGGYLMVSSRSPVIIHAEDFGLKKGIEALRNVAKLPAISTAVPVNFVLTFQQK